VILGGFFSICLLPLGFLAGTRDNYILTGSFKSTFKSIETEEKIEEKKIDTEGGVITVISDKVGETIDLEESNNYNLFSNVQGFQSAVLFKLPNGMYVFEITILDVITGEETIEQVIQTESQINGIRNYVEQFE